MTDHEEQLQGLGLDTEQVTAVVDIMERETSRIALAQAAQLLHVIFLRVERDSTYGCALRRALGFSSGESLARAAKAFGVSKQYLHNLQTELEQQLGQDLCFISRQARERPAIENERPAPRPARFAGPSFDEPFNR